MGEELDKAVRHAKFNDLYIRNSEDLLAFAIRRTQIEAEALDILAETMLVAWRRLDEIPDGSAARLWLFGVARNVMNNSRRTTRRRLNLVAKIASQFNDVFADDQVEFEPNTWNITIALQKLKPLEAEIILLNVWDELSPSEISILLDIPNETVRTHLHRARLKLKKYFESTEVGG